MRKQLIAASVLLALGAPAWSQSSREATAHKRAPASRDASRLPRADDPSRDSSWRNPDPVIDDGPPPPGQREAVRQRREAEQERRMEDALRRSRK